MKRIITVFLSLMICFSFAACSDANDIDVPMGMMLASDPDLPNYVLMVPNDWTIENSTGTVTANYRDNLSNQVLATFSATFNTPESKNVTAESYFDTYIKEYTQTFGEPKDIDSAPCLLDNKEAMKYTYSATFGDTEYKFWQVICIHEGIIYTLTYSATAQYFDNYAEDMSLILSNFYFK